MFIPFYKALTENSINFFYQQFFSKYFFGTRFTATITTSFHKIWIITKETTIVTQFNTVCRTIIAMMNEIIYIVSKQNYALKLMTNNRKKFTT